jgi:hypothetical protein
MRTSCSARWSQSASSIRRIVLDKTPGSASSRWDGQRLRHPPAKTLRRSGRCQSMSTSSRSSSGPQ